MQIFQCALCRFTTFFEAVGALAPEQLRKVTDNFETTKFLGGFLTTFCFLAANRQPVFIVLTLLQAPPGRLVSQSGCKGTHFPNPLQIFRQLFFQKKILRRTKTDRRPRWQEGIEVMEPDKTPAEARSTDKFAGADGDCRISLLQQELPDFTIMYGRDCLFSP